MKTPYARRGPNRVTSAIGLLAAASLNITPLMAQQFIWVPGGPLNWDTTTVAWDPLATVDGTADAAWVNGNVTADALFTNFFPGVGAINVGPSVDTNIMTVAAPGFSFSGGNINFIGAGSSLLNASGAPLTISSAVSAADTLIIAGGSAVNLNGGFTGTNGLVVFGAGTTTTVNGAAAFTGPAATITNASGANLLFGSTLGSVGALTVTGGDPVTVTGATTTGGDLTVNGGTSLVTSSALNVFGGVTVDGVGSALVSNGGLGASGGLVVQGGGAASLTGATTVGSVTAIGAGSSLTVNTGLDSGSDLFVVDGAVASFSGTVNAAGQLVASGAGTVVTTNGPLNMGSNVTVATNATAFFNGAVTGPGQLVVTDGSTAVLSGANTYSGGTVGFGAGATIVANNGSALGDGESVLLSGGANLIVNANEVIGSLSGDAASGVSISNAGEFLTLGGDNTDTSFAGVIGGAGGLVKEGTGTFTLSGANSYGDITFLNGGSIIAASNDALGSAAAGTVITGTAQLGLTGGIVTAEGVTIGYGGTSTPFLAALVADDASILNISGDNVFAGPIAVASPTARVNSDADNLLIGSTIVGAAGTDDLIAFGGAGNNVFIPGSSIGGGIEWVYKDGSGILSLSGSSGSSFTGGTIIQEGTVVFDGADDLGAPGSQIIVIGDSDLVADTTAGPISLAGRTYSLFGGVTSNVDVTGADALTMDLAGVVSAGGPNTLRKTGAGSLNLVVNPGDATAVGIPPGTPKAQTPLFAPTSITFGGFEAAVLDPASGPLVIDNSANVDRTSVVVAGLGNTSDPALSVGTVNLINANLIVNGAVPTFFGGTIIGDGNIGIEVDTLLDAANPGFSGQISVYNGATLTVGDAGALGTAGNYDFNGTYVDAGSTIALNDLGGVALDEGITLFNNARLINNTGNNTLSSQLQIEHDLNAAPNIQLASVGVVDGQLNLLGGIEAHNTGDMSVALNTEAGQNGTLVVAGAIAGNVQNVLIGEGTSTGTVVLGTNNSFAGNTQIFGGTVFAGANGAFSNGLVNVAGDATLATGGAILANNFVLNGGTTLSTSGLTQMNGGIDGLGGLTVLSDTLVLNGPSTFSGATQVDAGATLLVGNSFASTQVTVDGVLGTTTSDVLNDATQMTVNAGGTFALGGNESIRSVGGAGIVDTNIYSLGLLEGTFDGDIIGLGDVNKSSNGILSLTNPQSFLGALNVLDGTVELGAAGGLATPDINISDGGTLSTGGADQIVDTADLQVDGVLSLGGDETIGTLNGGSTGVVDLNTFGITVFDGTFAGSITNAHGDLNKVGPGTLTLSGTSTYVGETHVEEGVLTLTATGSLTGTSAIDIDAGAVVNLNGSNQVNDAADIVLNFDGPGSATINVSGTETVASVVDVNGGGIIGGAGELTATNYSLNGTTVNADLGTGTLGSTGNSTLNGDADADITVVTGGTLTVNGNLTNTTGDVLVNSGGTLTANGTLAGDTVTVDAGGTLNTGSSERLANDVTLTANGAVNLGGDETIGTLNGGGTVANNGNLLTVDDGSFSGVISGSGGLDKTGTGTLTLTGANTYTGNTRVLGGTLDLTGGSIASVDVSVAQLGTLNINGTSLPTNANVTVDGTMNVGGDTTIANLFGGSTGQINLGSSILTLSGVDFGGVITGTGGIDVQGGNLTLGGNNTFTGTTLVSSGTTILNGTLDSSIVTIDPGAELQLGSSHRIIDSATINVDGTLNMNGNEEVSLVNVSGTVNGNGELTAANYALTDGAQIDADLGTGDLTSSGATTINGDGNMDTTTVTGGTLTLNGNLTNATGDVTVNNGATLDANGTIAGDDVTVDAGGTLNTGSDERLASDVNLTVDGTVNLGGDETIGTLDGAASGVVNNNGNDLTVDDGTYAGDITGSGDLNKISVGTLTLNSPVAYSGDTKVMEGVLTLGSGGGLTNSLNIEVDSGATLNTGGSEQLNDGATLLADGQVNLGGNETIMTLNGTGGVELNSFDLTVDDGTFGGTISGTGNLNKESAGTLALTGANTFSGDTNINLGALELSGTLVNTANVNVGNGATLDLLASERINDAAVLSAVTGGTIDLNGIETVADFNLGGLLRGTGRINAATYDLTDGAETQAGADLGDGILTSNGNTLLGGDSGANTVTVQTGTMTVNGSITNPLGLTITIDSGATMALGFDERLGDNAVLNNFGELDLNGDETITTYNADGGFLDAAGTLTALTYNLSNGASTAVGANLGTGILNSGPGTVTLNGDAAVETANILSGTLNLNGQLTDVDDVNISAGAIVNLGSDERINDGATVNNDGTLNLNGVETITTYNSTGTLGGTGTLVADTYNLEDGSVTNPGANLGGGTLNIGCNTPGVIAINGNAASEDVTVCTGSTLNLGGQLTAIGTSTSNPGDNLTIESGATLNLSATADQINDNGVVINDGTLNLHGAETVGTFISSGTLGLAGGAPVPSILTTQGNTINLLDGHVSLIGTGLAGIGPDPQLTSNGNVAINGTANNTSAVNNATLDVNTAVVQSGTLTLDGLIISDVNATPDITVNSGATLVSGSANRITDSATVTIDNGGVWNLGSGGNNGDDTITTFNAGGQLNNGGPGISTLTADTYNLTGGAEINANLGTGVLNSNNSIENLANTLNGDAAVGDANITSGVFNLNGQLTIVNTVDISSGAIVNLGSSERINNGAIVNNFGELDLNGTETVTTYNSDGGFLDSTGLLTAVTYNLEDGASSAVGADIGNSGTFNSNGGTVTLNGKLNTDFIEINSGNLVTNGAVGDVTTGRITVDSGATWNVNSSYDYDVLRGVGNVDPGGSNGNTFTNRDIISPGYDNIGELNILGNYIEDGIYDADLAPSPSSDTLDVNGNASLDNNSVLRLAEYGGLDSGNVLCGERWNIIDSWGTIGDLNSNFDRTGFNEITDVDNLGPNGVTFDSQVLFDRGTGDVVALGLGAGETIADYAGINQNQINILSTVLDDATDGVGNYNSNDGTVGTVLDAVYTYGVPGDKDAMSEAINLLSPESYAGLADYALHVTRNYTQNATLLRARRGSSGDFMVPLPDKSSAKGGVPSAKGGMYDAKGGMYDPKGGLGAKEPYAPAPTYPDYELFGGFSYLSLGSDSSNNRADYEMQSYGGYAGFRRHVNMNLALGGFLGIDNGTVDASANGADLDSDGYIFGAFANYLPQGPEGPSMLWANMSYGSFEFHGHRNGLLGRYRIRDVEADALQFGVGGGYRFYETDSFSLSAGAGLRYVDSEVDGFTESGGAGALVVSDQKEDALLFDINLQGLYQEPGSPVAVYGEVGWQHNFSDTDRDIDAMFVGGSSTFSVNAPGLDEDAFTYGIGVIYDINEQYQLGAGYRGEWRSDSEPFHGFDLNVTVGF